MMLTLSGSYHVQGFLSGLLLLFLFLVIYLREKKTQIKNSIGQSDLYGRFRTTFVQCKDSAFNCKVRSRLESEVGDYQPPWWYSPHIGTLFAFGQDQQLKYETEIFESESSRFTLDWFPNRPTISKNDDKPLNIIVFLPGLGLTSRNKFAQNFASTVSTAGFYTVVVGSRGIDVPLKTNQFWHPGNHEDATAVVDHIFEAFGVTAAGGARSSTNRKKGTTSTTASSTATAATNKLRIFITGYSAGSNITQQVILNTRHKRCAEVIRGAMCVCINYDYLASRKALEGTFIGGIYSMLMTHALKDIIRKNSHVHNSIDGGSSHLARLLTSCTFMSDYDRIFGKHLHGYPSPQDMNAVLSMHEAHRIDIPLLAIQPSDDPLHMGQVRTNICLDKVTANQNIIYLEPQHGNHFGFYEGPLTAAFSNTTSYTYPARLAVSFFNTIIDHEASVSEVKSRAE